MSMLSVSECGCCDSVSMSLPSVAGSVCLAVSVKCVCCEVMAGEVQLDVDMVQEESNTSGHLLWEGINLWILTLTQFRF